MVSEERPPEPEPQPNGVQACYRHPGQQTGVCCARCDRPICVECMNQASVGFHCPECVRAGEQSARAPRTTYGGRLTSGGALVTKVLIVLNVLVFVATKVFSDQFTEALMLVRGPAWNGALEEVGVAVGPEQWYRMVTAVFLHQQVWHIAMNMLALWLVGPQLESLLGRARFLGLYLVSGLGGAALYVLTAANNEASLGASGAIFGLFGAVLVLTRRQNYDVRPVLALIAINLVFTFAFHNAIDWRGHVGGLVVGTLVAVGLVYPPRAWRGLVQGLSLGAALVFAVAAALFA